jgi:hypothetical protein
MRLAWNNVLNRPVGGVTGKHGPNKKQTGTLKPSEERRNREETATWQHTKQAEGSQHLRELSPVRNNEAIHG